MRRHRATGFQSVMLLLAMTLLFVGCDQSVLEPNHIGSSREKIFLPEKANSLFGRVANHQDSGLYPCLVTRKKDRGEETFEKMLGIPFRTDDAPLHMFRFMKSRAHEGTVVTIDCIAPDIPWVHARLLKNFSSHGISEGASASEVTDKSGSVKAADLEYVWDERLGMYVFNEILVEDSEIVDDDFRKWLELLDGSVFTDVWYEGDEGGGWTGGGSMNMTGVDFDSDLVMDPDCENPRNAGEAAFCRGWTPSSKHKEKIRQIVTRIANRGGVCSDLAIIGNNLLSNNGFRLYIPSHSKESAYAGHDGSWIAIAYPWLEYSDERVAIESSPGYVDLEMILVHELDHAFGHHFHTDLEGVKLPDSENSPYTPNLFECAGISR